MRKRSAGLLLPVASLPSPSGIGDFGSGADLWIEWLAAAGQRVWAILPLLIPDSVGSPYASPSAFAGNWLLISPERLASEQLIPARPRTRLNHGRINYARLNITRRRLLGRAWLQFQSSASPSQRQRFHAFQTSERSWLNDYTLYMAIKDRLGGKPWPAWPVGLRNRAAASLRSFNRRYGDERAYFAFGQWVFDEQWHRLKARANRFGLKILGDLPYAVALDSVDVWRNRRYFKVGLTGRFVRQIGAPPDVMNARGQLWRMPAYDWTTLELDGFAWWIERFQRARRLYDLIRLDHFRGFSAIWEIPAAAADARAGRWTPVPGDALFRAIRATVGRLPALAEDLGLITDSVNAFRARLGFPGMRVLQFGFESDHPTYHYPSEYPTDSVAFTGTHDLPPLAAWLRSAPTAEATRALRFAHATKRTALDRLVRAGLATRSSLFIAQAQDVFGLGPASRINTPGTTGRNWTWRLPASKLTNAKSAGLRRMLVKTGRIH